jgi:hypothetical protein
MTERGVAATEHQRETRARREAQHHRRALPLPRAPGGQDCPPAHRDAWDAGNRQSAIRPVRERQEAFEGLPASVWRSLATADRLHLTRAWAGSFFWTAAGGAGRARPATNRPYVEHARFGRTAKVGAGSRRRPGGNESGRLRPHRRQRAGTIEVSAPRRKKPFGRRWQRFDRIYQFGADENSVFATYIALRMARELSEAECGCPEAGQPELAPVCGSPGLDRTFGRKRIVQLAIAYDRAIEPGSQGARDILPE